MRWVLTVRPSLRLRAIQAARQYGARVLLVGPENILKAELSRHRGVAPAHRNHSCQRIITMHDKARKPSAASAIHPCA